MLFLEGTENEFTYTQILYYCKDDTQKIKRKNKCLVLFEPDDTREHICKSNIIFLKILFTSDDLIQNPPTQLRLYGLLTKKESKRKSELLMIKKNYT